MAQPARSSRSDGSPITIHGWCVALRKPGTRSRRMDTGIGASTRWRPKNFGKMCVHPRRCSKMCVVPPSGDSARPTFRFAPVASGRSTSYSKRDSATIRVCFPFVVRDTAIVRRRSCRTRCIARREHCASCRWPRRRGAARAFRLPAARIFGISRSASFAAVSVSIRTPAFRPRSTCIRGSSILISRVSPLDGLPKRVTTVDSRARVHAWSSCSPNFASRRRRDA